MSDPVVIAFIGAGSTITTAALGLLLKLILGLRREVNVVRDNIANDHPKNFRDEQDERHEENVGRMEENTGRLGSLERRMSKLEPIARKAATDASATRQDMDRVILHLGIERTNPRKRST